MVIKCRQQEVNAAVHVATTLLGTYLLYHGHIHPTTSSIALRLPRQAIFCRPIGLFVTIGSKGSGHVLFGDLSLHLTLLEAQTMAPMKSPSHRETEHPFEGTYSLTHLAHLWGVSRREVRELLKTGEVPFLEIEGQLRVPAGADSKVCRDEKPE